MATSLSVESRVKAHIPTPFISADTTTRNTVAQIPGFSNSAEYDAEKSTERSSQQFLSLLEQKAMLLESRNQEKCSSQRTLVAKDVAGANVSERPTLTLIEQKRTDTREADREADAAVHFHLYQKRNESLLAQQAFDESLKPSVDAIIRNREEQVSRRHKELDVLRLRANRSQYLAISEEKSRKAAAAASGEASLAKKMIEQSEAERLRMIEDARVEYETILSERQRQTELRRIELDVRLKKEVQSGLWARERSEATATAERISRVALEAEQKTHASEIEVQQAIASGSYMSMKALQARLEAMCSELLKAIHAVNSHGSCFNALIEVAKEKADARGKGFDALTRVCNSTLAPTAFTPTILPQPVRRTATVSCQTNVSEPVRPVSHQKGRRI